VAIEFNTLTTTLTHLLDGFNGAQTLIAPLAKSLLNKIALLEIALLAARNAIGGESPSSLLMKAVYIGVWLHITTNFPHLADSFVQSLIEMGLSGGGRSGDHQLLMDPSRIAGMGLEATKAFPAALSSVTTVLGGNYLVVVLGYVGIMVAFLVIAIQVFVAVAEYYLILIIAAALVPWGVLGPTKWISEKAIGAVFAHGVKLMALALLLALIFPTLRLIVITDPVIQYNEMWGVLLLCWGFAFLALKAPDKVAGFLSGSPSLGASSLLQAGLGAASLATGAASTAVKATRAAASRGGQVMGAAGLAAARGVGFTAGAGKAGMERAAGRTSNTGAGDSPTSPSTKRAKMPGPVSAAAAGVASASAAAARQGLSSLAGRAVNPLAEAFKQGGANARAHLKAPLPQASLPSQSATAPSLSPLSAASSSSPAQLPSASKDAVQPSAPPAESDGPPLLPPV